MALVKFTTNQGDFTLDIDEVNAPKTAANFLQYVKDGHYDNTMLNASTAKENTPAPCKADNPPAQCKSYGWGYTAFGRVVQGMDIVDKMAEIPTGAGGVFPSDVPQTQIVIEKVTLVTKK